MKNFIENHKNIFSFMIITLCLMVTGDVSYSQVVKDKVLDGKVFTVDLNLQGGKKAPKPIADELSFKAGKFKSKFMATESKFTPAIYTITIDSSSTETKIAFDCESKNPDDEILHWVGTINGEAIEGTATLSKKEKVKKAYAFIGTLKAKKK